jgi:hypothetical protein
MATPIKNNSAARFEQAAPQRHEAQQPRNEARAAGSRNAAEAHPSGRGAAFDRDLDMLRKVIAEAPPATRSSTPAPTRAATAAPSRNLDVASGAGGGPNGPAPFAFNIAGVTPATLSSWSDGSFWTGVKPDGGQPAAPAAPAAPAPAAPVPGDPAVAAPPPAPAPAPAAPFSFAANILGVTPEKISSWSDGSFLTGIKPDGGQPAAPPPPPPNPNVPTEAQRKAMVENAKNSNSEEQQRAFLAALGIPEKHLNDTKGDKLKHAFGETLDAALQPGNHKRSLKLDKEYKLKLEVGNNLELTKAEAKKEDKSGFFGKALKTVASWAPTIGAVLGPVTGGISTAVGAAIGAVNSIRNKDYLGAISSVAGGIGGAIGSAAKLGGAIGNLAASEGLQAVATGANVISKGADAVKGAMNAVNAGSPGALISAVANGAGAVSGALGSAGQKLGEYADHLGRAGRITLNGEKAIAAIKTGDYLGAAESVLGAGAELTRPPALPAQGTASPGTPTPTAPTLSDQLTQASKIAGTLKKASAAYQSGDYTNLVSEGLRLANHLSGNQDFGRAANVAQRAGELITAVNGGNAVGAFDSARKLYEAVAEVEQLGLPKDPLVLAQNVLNLPEHPVDLAKRWAQQALSNVTGG